MEAGKSTHHTRQSVLPKFEYNHKCEKCQQSFKNSILLRKHECMNKTTSLNCSVCLKQFRDIIMLNIHKKSHSKLNLDSNTSIVNHTPKSIGKSASSSRSTVKITPKKSLSKQFGSFKSKQSSITKLKDKDISSPKNLRRSSITRLKHTDIKQSLNQSVLVNNLTCDKCNQKFATFRNLYTHKVHIHGLDTPDKSLMTKPKKGIYKPKAAHGGIPANERLKKAYAALRQKLADTENLNM